MVDRGRSGVVGGSIWMIVISLALFFLPLLNGLIGGFVGGYKTGSWKRALGAAILPAIAVTVGLWLIVAALGAPVIGFVAGTAAGILILLADVGIFVGAALGGWIAQSRSHAHGHI